MGERHERDLDPTRNTVPNAEGCDIWALDADGGIILRPAAQADLRHCASCTCPPDPTPSRGDETTPGVGRGGEEGVE